MPEVVDGAVIYNKRYYEASDICSGDHTTVIIDNGWVSGCSGRFFSCISFSIHRLCSSAVRVGMLLSQSCGMGAVSSHNTYLYLCVL